MRAPGIIVSAFLLMLYSCNLSAQERDSADVEIQNQLEEALEEQEDEQLDQEGEQLIQFLQDLAANPVDINSAAVDELLQIPGLNLKTAKAIVDYRKKTPFESVDEIEHVAGIGPATLRQIRPYITIGNFSRKIRSLYTNPRYWTAGSRAEIFSRVQQTIETQEGFRRPDSSGGFAGNPIQYYQRFRYQSRHLSLNLTQQKDAGEPVDGITGFDFNSFHVAVQNVGLVQDLVIGDYSLTAGQGLVFWNGGAFGKGREVVSAPNRNERGLRGYTSAQETDFFRGAAITAGKKLQATVFFSDQDQTASVLAADTLRFFSSSGFHRTQAEIERKDNLSHRVVGGRLRYRTNYGMFGISGYQSNFDKFIGKGPSLSSRFDFSGKEHTVTGVDYRGVIGQVLLFGELARSQNGGLAGIAGLGASLGSKTEGVVSYRNYERDFQSFFGDGFGESSGTPQNEEGFYAGLRHELNTFLSLSGYMDQYHFPAPRFGTTQPTSGRDVLGLLEINAPAGFEAYALFRDEVKENDFTGRDDFGREQLLLGEEHRTNIRIHLQFQANPKIRLRSRGEWVRYRGADNRQENGYLLYQDVRFIPNKKWKIDARVTVFDTDGFDSRIFQFENDLLYVLSNVALFDRGERMYVLVNYEPFSYLELWAKYSVTIFEDTFRISSGLNEIRGDSRSKAGIQARLKF